MSMLTVEECELLTDPKYRSYITQVEKALRSFEYTSEWADLISALGKLNKVLLSHMKFQVIPKKVTIGKRLAQCLHPALPSGVHLKALETYDIIFKCIGTQRLANDLFIYSAGLFPLLGHSAMSVKPVLLTVYEKHFVALGRHIKPGLNGLLLGLLPGLEEGAEYFERTNMLLEDFCNAVGPPFFYTGIWECMLSCPSVRLCGATFLLNHLNKRQSMEDQLHMIGLDIDLMVSGICACLQDVSVLVQRSMLDFLLLAFPMHNGQLTRADMGKVVAAGITVVLRRDMSLNRRLYAWLLGTSTTTTMATTDSHHSRMKDDNGSVTSEMDLGYFQNYSKDLLVAAVKAKLMEDDSVSLQTSDGLPSVLKPFRILISLLDKPEIGPVIIEDVLLSVFRRLKIEGNLFSQNEAGKASIVAGPESSLPVETHKTANLLFGSFEPYFIWDFIARMYSTACEQRSRENDGSRADTTAEMVSITELCDLVEFLLDVIALDVYPETTTEHLPDLLRQLISSLTASCDTVTETEVTITLKLCSKLLSRVQPSMPGLGPHSHSQDPGDNISVFSLCDVDSGKHGDTVLLDKNKYDELKSHGECDIPVQKNGQPTGQSLRGLEISQAKEERLKCLETTEEKSCTGLETTRENPNWLDNTQGSPKCLETTEESLECLETLQKSPRSLDTIQEIPKCLETPQENGQDSESSEENAKCSGISGSSTLSLSNDTLNHTPDTQILEAVLLEQADQDSTETESKSSDQQNSGQATVVMGCIPEGEDKRDTADDSVEEEKQNSVQATLKVGCIPGAASVGEGLKETADDGEAEKKQTSTLKVGCTPGGNTVGKNMKEADDGEEEKHLSKESPQRAASDAEYITCVTDASKEQVCSGSNLLLNSASGLCGSLATSAIEKSEVSSIDDYVGRSSHPKATSRTASTTSNAKLLSGHLGLMQLCVQSFQQFFHRFTQLKILRSPEFCAACMKVITCSVSVGGSKGAAAENGPLQKLELEKQVDEVIQSYRQACRLLVDFASFPIYCIDYEAIIEQMCIKEDSSVLPPWLQDLVISSCFVDSFEVQSASVSTLLDLISLTQSVQTESESKSRHHGRQSVGEGTVSVVILPALLPTHLVYINGKTRFYQIVASELWVYLSDKFSSYHQRAVELFHALHQVTPNSSICEDVIGHDLISESEVDRITAFKKFSVLWHLTRSIKTEPNPSRSPRTFDRSMFVVLDSLKEETSITKMLALTWLTHVIQRGDTSRVLQPLLLMLLHPDTARISIQHVSVHKPKKVAVSEEGEDDVEAKIYAISSEGGNIIYHVSQGKQPQLSKKPVQKSTDDLKSYALSVMNNKGGHSTAPVRTHSVTDLSFERVNPEKVKLRINPFGSESSLDKLIFDGYDFPQSASMPNLEGVKRLNTDTCKKEGIFFDGSELIEDHFSQEDSKMTVMVTSPSPEEEKINERKELREQSEQNDGSSAEDVARWIMDGVISAAVMESLGNSTPNESEGDLLVRNHSNLGMDQSYISPSLDDLRKLDGDSSSGSENGDIKNFSSASESLQYRYSANSNNKSGSMESLTNQDSEHAIARPIDPRDLDPSTDIHELHMHMLLYAQQYDYRRILYALSTLRAMLHSCPRLVVTAMATTSISSVKAPHLAKLQSLLGRHRKSVFGKNFFGDLPAEVMSSYRSNMFVEIVISLCLYFVRGYYPNLMMSKLTTEELLGNRMVHILGVEILTSLVAELLSIMKESGKNFVSYISDLLSRCKLQKSLLHCLLASVYNQGRSAPPPSHSVTNSSSSKADTVKLTEMIIDFNENSLEPSVNDTFQIKLLQLMLVMIMFEDQIRLAQGAIDAGTAMGEKTHLTSSLVNVHHNPNLPIIQQEMFLSAVWSALKQHHQCHLHRHWIGLVTSALPYMGKAMARTVLCVVLQLCRNLEIIASDLTKKKSSMQRIPPDHVVSMLEGLTTLCHYCLLENTSPASIGQPAPTSTNISTETASAGQILTNLIHVFNPVTSGKEPSPARDSAPVSPIMDSRNRLLSILPRIMACMATLWKAVAITTEDGSLSVTSHPAVGDFKAVRQQILEFLSPISLPHGTHLLAAFAVAWNDRRQRTSVAAASKKGQMNLVACEDQLLLVELVSAVKVLPTDTLIQTVKQAIKQPPQSELGKKGLPLEVNLLQFFFAYVRHTASSSQLLDSWQSLLSLLRECLQMNLSPPALFLLLQILNEFVQKTPTMEEKKNQKDLQDICQKALEAISAIAGSSLEQTTWLRRNFAVKPGPQNEAEDEGEAHDDMAEAKKEVSAVKAQIQRSQVSDSKYSVQALVLLAELTAPLLDVIYGSDEKDKVAPFLTTLLYNVFPYLRHHSSHNLPSYRACSQMLASVSEYQYTRRAWRKEAFEMLMESSFFQMDVRSIVFWRTIIDNLMTHDKTTFKDLMSRVVINQTGSLNLFSSKEQEYELRSQMMKRLAFTIFCSETDQYQRAMPEIQERLAECLRLPQVANVMSSVFLCFRVLILRMSPQHLTSLWPTIITEMVQVLLQVEQELSAETDEFKTQIQRIAALDSSWAHLGNGLNAHNNPAWLQLYLSVCKLLDMCIVMPADQVPQFQLYRWAFVGTAGEEDYITVYDSDDPTWRPNPLFMPHIIRLSRLINNTLKKRPALLKSEPGRPLLTIHRLRSLSELQSFFYTLSHNAGSSSTTSHSLLGSKDGSVPAKLSSTQEKEQVSSRGSGTAAKDKKDSSMMSNREYVEHLLEIDFLEPLV